jgi:hypothetical protein
LTDAGKVGLQAAKGVFGHPASIIDYEQVTYDQFTLVTSSLLAGLTP